MKSQIQFNWIFIVIVGAIILLFFTGFAMKYKDLQEQKQEIIFLNNFDKALTNLQSSGFRTSTSLDLPMDINVDCDSIYVNERHETSNLFFSSPSLKNDVYIWYYPFEYPFIVTNFYFLIDNVGLTIQTNNPILVNELIDDMPENFKDKVSLGSGKQVDIQGDINYGTVIINGQSYPYYGKAMLYGALFSNNYGCLLGKVNSRFDNTINSYLNKISLLQRSGCNYGLIYNQLSILKTNKDYSLIQNIEDLNQDLASLNCPVVF